MNYEKVFENIRKELLGSGWTSFNSGKGVALIVAISKQLNYLGVENDIVIFDNFDKIPLVRIGEDYYSTLGKVEDDAFSDLGMEKLDHALFHKQDPEQLTKNARWLGSSEEQHKENILRAQSAFQKSLAKYVISESPMNFELDSVGNRLYVMHSRGFDISRMMFHETKKVDEAAIIKNGFDLSMGESAKSDYQMPSGVFVKPNDEKIHIHKEEVVQMPFFIKKGNCLEVSDRKQLNEYLLSSNKEWKTVFENISKCNDFYNKETEEHIATIPELIDTESRRNIKANFDKMMKEWRGKLDEYYPLAKKAIRDELINNNINSISLVHDQGSWGREVETILLLNVNDLAYANPLDRVLLKELDKEECEDNASLKMA